MDGKDQEKVVTQAGRWTSSTTHAHTRTHKDTYIYTVEAEWNGMGCNEAGNDMFV